MFQKKELPPVSAETEKQALIDEITAEVEQKYRENFNFSCLFQDQEPDGVIVKYAGAVACLLVIVNIIISWK